MQSTSAAIALPAPRQTMAANLALIAGLFYLLFSLPALADCPKTTTLPAAREGAIGYDRVVKCIFVCTGTFWENQCTSSLPLHDATLNYALSLPHSTAPATKAAFCS